MIVVMTWPIKYDIVVGKSCAVITIGRKKFAQVWYQHVKLDRGWTYQQNKEHFCKLCPYKSNKRLNVVRHNAITHLMNGGFSDQKCAQCSITFFASEDLNNHLCMHTPYN